MSREKKKVDHLEGGFFFRKPMSVAEFPLSPLFLFEDICSLSYSSASGKHYLSFSLGSLSQCLLLILSLPAPYTLLIILSYLLLPLSFSSEPHQNPSHLHVSSLI